MCVHSRDRIYTFQACSFEHEKKEENFDLSSLYILREGLFFGAKGDFVKLAIYIEVHERYSILTDGKIKYINGKEVSLQLIHASMLRSNLMMSKHRSEIIDSTVHF